MGSLITTEMHLWLNLSGMGDKNKVSLLDTSDTPSGLFGSMVNSIINRFWETKQQTASVSQFLPHRVEFPQATMSGARASTNVREAHKVSVVAHHPLQKARGVGSHSHSLLLGLI